jgi:hypothetical protein
MKAVRLRLTFANVTSVTALVFAMAGGAYALSGVPDRGGVFHGCVSNSTGVLRVVKSASSCQKAKTVRRHGKRVRLPGEFAVAWNQKGQPGANGANGINGTDGQNGATKVTFRSAPGGAATAGNESSSQVVCNPGENETGGGATVSTANGSAYALRESGPNGGGWTARAQNTAPSGNETVTVTSWALCASP